MSIVIGDGVDLVMGIFCHGNLIRGILYPKRMLMMNLRIKHEVQKKAHMAIFNLI